MTLSDQKRHELPVAFVSRTWRRAGWFGAAAMVGASLLVGCSAPPSAVPLMRVARKAMRQETKHLKQDEKRLGQRLNERQRALKVAFETDLQQRDELTLQWVLEGTAGYVAAREALLRQHFKVRAGRRQRLKNLQAAMRAQERAMAMLQRQDRLLTRALGGDVWDLRELLSKP
jgi:hypothetical protein